MIPIQEYEIYKLAEKLSDIIWSAYDHWPEKAQRTIGYQIIRSSDSIAANLAEGFGRFTGPDRKRFYRIARGSYEETKAWLRKGYRRKVITEEEMKSCADIIHELGPKLNAFINSTK